MKKTIKLFSFILVAVLLAACSKSDNKAALTPADFKALTQKVADGGKLTPEEVDGIIEYFCDENEKIINDYLKVVNNAKNTTELQEGFQKLSTDAATYIETQNLLSYIVLNNMLTDKHKKQMEESAKKTEESMKQVDEILAKKFNTSFAEIFMSGVDLKGIDDVDIDDYDLDGLTLDDLDLDEHDVAAMAIDELENDIATKTKETPLPDNTPAPQKAEASAK